MTRVTKCSFLLLLMLSMTRMGFAQSLVETVDFGPLSATGTNVSISKYTAADQAMYGPLTSVYVYITGDLSGSGNFVGNGGTPSISSTSTLSSNTFSTPISLTLTGSTTASGPLASGQSSPFSFDGMSLTGSVMITSNLANYTGAGTFNVNLDAGTPQTTVSGASGITYNSGQNANSAFPISGTITISYNYPYTPVPEPKDWMLLGVIGCIGLMVVRKLRFRAKSQLN